MTARIMMDERFMLNKVELDDALGMLADAKAYEFTTMEASNSRRRYGVSGQSLVEKCPAAVECDGLGYYYVNADQLVPVLAAAVLELKAKVDALSAPARRRKAAEPVEAPAE